MPNIDKILRDSMNPEVLHDIEYFYKHVNSRSEFLHGKIDEYVEPEPALGETVEYFHPIITYDDRMKYICEHIVTSPDLSEYDKVCNTIISHFYGARGIHQTLSGINDPDKAYVKFDVLAEEQKSPGVGEYTEWLRNQAEQAKRSNIKLWGTTELHTSIQTSGRRWVNEHYLGDSRHKSKGTSANVCEWIASWINDGTIDKILNVNGFKELVYTFMEQPGISHYYGYHGAASSSNNPSINAYVDEDFCLPGPGAVMTCKELWPGVSKKDVPFGDRIIWFCRNQHNLIDVPKIHEDFWNITRFGKEIYPEPQNKLTVYGNEVLFCQFSVFVRLRENPHLIDKRKVARTNTNTCTLDAFFS